MGLPVWIRRLEERNKPEHLDVEDWVYLKAIAVGGEAVRDRQGAPLMGETIELHVNGCAYSCCGRGWQRRDGYEQVYYGYVDNLTNETLMLYSLGIGTISYVVAVRFDEILEIVR